MILARYQCVDYFDYFGSPADPRPIFSSGYEKIFFHHFGANHYMLFGWQKNDKDLVVSREMLNSIHRGIEYAHDNLLVKGGVWGRLESPDPFGYAVLADPVEHPKIQLELGTQKDLVMPLSHYNPEEFSGHYIAKVRQDFLAAAERSALGRARVSDYVRTLEAAFALAGDPLIKAVTAFLSASPMFRGTAAYTKSEVRSWIAVRGRLVHADKKKNWIDMSEAWPLVPRLRQAVFDVVVSKENWNSKGLERIDKLLMNAVVRHADHSGLTLRKNSGTVQLTTFNVDRLGTSFFNKSWLPRVAGESKLQTVPYLEPLMAKFPNLSLVITKEAP